MINNIQNPNKFTYSEKQYIDQIFTFMQTILTKSEYEAQLNETLDSKRSGNAYVLAKYKRDSLYDYIFTTTTLINAGMPSTLVSLYETNPSKFYNTISESYNTQLLTYLRDRRIEDYVEENPYYLTLNAEPTKESEYVYIEDPLDPSIKIPLHLINEIDYPNLYIYLMDNGKENLKRILSQYDYEYLRYFETPIPYHVARNARNFHILVYSETNLNKTDMQLFFDLYYESLQYFMNVCYTPQFAEYELYDKFVQIIIFFMTMTKLLNTKFHKYIVNNFPTKEEQRNFLKSYNMEYVVDLLPEQYIKILVKNIDYLISLKGSDKVIVEILRLFEVTDIDIFKFALVKTCKVDSFTKEPNIDVTKTKKENYDLNLVQILIKDEYQSKSENSYISNKLNHVDLEFVTSKDPYWGGNSKVDGLYSEEDKLRIRQEIEDTLKQNHEFSYIYTKYLGSIAHIDIMKHLIHAVYFLTSIINSNQILDIRLAIDFIPDITCSIRELLASINLIYLRKYGIDDTITRTTSTVAGYMAFNTNPSLEDFKNKKYFNITEQGWIEVTLPEVLEEDEIFVNKSPSDITGLSDEVIVQQWKNNYDFNIAKFKEITKTMLETSDYEKYLAYDRIYRYNMYSKSMNDMFAGYDKYEDFLSNTNPKLLEFINNYLFEKAGDQFDINGKVNLLYKSVCSELMGKITDKIIELLSDDPEINGSIDLLYKDNVDLFSNIFTLIEIFKSYTVDLSMSNTNNLIKVEKLTTLKILYTIFDMDANAGDYREIIESFINDQILEYYGTDIRDTNIKLKHDAIISRLTYVNENIEILYDFILNNDVVNMDIHELLDSILEYIDQSGYSIPVENINIIKEDLVEIT